MSLDSYTPYLEYLTQKEYYPDYIWYWALYTYTLWAVFLKAHIGYYIKVKVEDIGTPHPFNWGVPAGLNFFVNLT